MEYSERVLCESGEVELDPNIVSEEAGKLYSELQTVIETHGEGVVESLVPIFVWVLEGLAGYTKQRKHSGKKVKRGTWTDQLLALEEQKEYSQQAGSHISGLLEKRKDSERDSPLRNHVRLKNAEFSSNQVSSEASMNEKMIQRPHSLSGPPCLEDVVNAIDISGKPAPDQFINDIISSTPELRHFHGSGDASTPLSELSRDYVESVDRGASVRGSADQFEEILCQYEELKVTHELVEAARKALISRVVELTDDRSALKLEVTSLQETASRLEGRMKEKEEETKRIRKELETCQSEDPDASLPTSMRHFSRSEMARVVMEKNQYKQRLLELQEAVRKSQTLRAINDERLTDDKSVWKKFNRFFGLTKGPLIPRPAPSFARPTSPSLTRPPLGSPQLPAVGQTRAERREIYKEIRSYLWGSLGKRQIHGWSTPLANTQESHEPVPEPKDVPVLIQLRLLDQRDSTAKMNCAVAVAPEISGEATCSVWVVSGPASCSDITVIDPARSNTVLDQFSLAPTAPALCICAVPPIGDTAGTVWIGTQEGSMLVHSASAGRRLCLHSVSLSEGVHSLTYSQGKVIAGLADGTLAFFSHSSDGWNLEFHSVLPLGSNPLQPIRCCLEKSGRLWVGYWNKIHVVDVDSKKVEQTFSVSERSEQQVRFLCAGGSGVWTSCRLDPILRLFDWSTGRPLQEVDFTALVTKTLGQAFLTLSPLQISSLAVISGRLWVGTGGGAIFTIPLSITSEAVSIPYCSISSAQLCYHGHRQAVRFIIAAPSCLIIPPGSTTITNSQLIISGGEGHINFRLGDDASEESEDLPKTTPQRSERSQMIIWQNPTPSVPSPAL
ncbi:C-Jun-amino-terminal kinase-interacting protein 4 [Dissostichus eleginoides]|uniref:C-Jun-amino-terminal kinase-interacting protein 4 n=1 Tax=Dissostichus eleginoides TaxID=100907 RepID=A0AAD9C3A9_DISEL|nr:C-Jun-amino-terminal kinase-interacting protein 4 [Dissostichus eleginoides]